MLFVNTMVSLQKRININMTFILVLLLASCSNAYRQISMNSHQNHQFVPNTLKTNQNILDYNIGYYVDAGKQNACDIKVKETLSYSVDQPTNKIIHAILSKKLSYSDFTVASLTAGAAIKTIEISKSNAHRTQFINKDESQIYRDRWLINIEFTNNITTAVLEFNYNIQRAVMIDPMNEYDIIRISIINPFSNRMENLKFSVYLQNFKHLQNESIRVPPFSTLNASDRNNIQISTTRSLPVYGQLFMQFTLPMEITVCEPNMVKVVYYGMVGMTASFVIIALIAFAYIYKE